jgi:hypothetical protein
MVTFLRPGWLNLLHNRKWRDLIDRRNVLRSNSLLKNEEFLKTNKLEQEKGATPNDINYYQ